MERLSNVVEILSVEAANRDSAVCSHVNSVLVAELLYHLLLEASVCKHTNLVDNVLPAVLAATLDKFVVETLSHVKHAARHDLELSVPLLHKFRVLEDDVDQASSMNGRVGPDGAGDLLQSRHDDLGLGLATSDD